MRVRSAPVPPQYHRARARVSPARRPPFALSSGHPRHSRQVTPREGPLLAVRIEQIRSATGAQPEVVDLHPRAFKVDPDRLRQREVTPGDHLLSEPAREFSRELLRDLVAALPDARPDVCPNR